MSLFDELDPSPSAAARHDASLVDERTCEWCHGPIPTGSRRDAVYCRQSCRQAAHRFKRGAVLRPATDRPLRLAYADPPYPGKAGIYRDHPDYAGEVDHSRLVEQLVDEFPDGWALSTSARALPDVLRACPRAVRVAAWFRGERPTFSYQPLNAWEPVVFMGGRPIGSDERPERRLDALQYVSRPRLTDPDRVVGAKPAAFCYWLFDLLGALPGDKLVDLFPGSGGVARAWGYYTTGVRRQPVAAAAALDRRETEPSPSAGETRRHAPELAGIPLDRFVSIQGSTLPSDEYSGRLALFERLRAGHHLPELADRADRLADHLELTLDDALGA